MSPLIQLPLSKLRRRLGAVVARVHHTGERVMILSHGKALAALVPMSDYRALEEAAAKSLEYKEYQMAEQMQRWSELRNQIMLNRAQDETRES